MKKSSAISYLLSAILLGAPALAQSNLLNCTGLRIGVNTLTISSNGVLLINSAPISGGSGTNTLNLTNSVTVNTTNTLNQTNSISITVTNTPETSYLAAYTNSWNAVAAIVAAQSNAWNTIAVNGITSILPGDTNSVWSNTAANTWTAWIQSGGGGGGGSTNTLIMSGADITAVNETWTWNPTAGEYLNADGNFQIINISGTYYIQDYPIASFTPYRCSGTFPLGPWASNDNPTPPTVTFGP